MYSYFIQTSNWIRFQIKMTMFKTFWYNNLFKCDATIISVPAKYFIPLYSLSHLSNHLKWHICMFIYFIVTKLAICLFLYLPKKEMCRGLSRSETEIQNLLIFFFHFGLVRVFWANKILGKEILNRECMHACVFLQRTYEFGVEEWGVGMRKITDSPLGSEKVQISWYWVGMQADPWS